MTLKAAQGTAGFGQPHGILSAGGTHQLKTAKGRILTLQHSQASILIWDRISVGPVEVANYDRCLLHVIAINRCSEYY